jgi:hypothetical protein
MGGTIPRKIKEKVLELWLQGFKRAEIAKKAGVGEGTITAIVNESRKNSRDHYDIDLLRAVAVMLRKEGEDLGDLAFSIRLRKIMDENSLSEDNMESTILQLAVYRFRSKLSLEKLLTDLHQAITLADNQNLRIDKIPEYICSGITKIESLELQRQELIRKKQSLMDKIDELNKEIEAPLERLTEENKELRIRSKENDELLKRTKEELRDWRKKYHILLMDRPEEMIENVKPAN